VINSGVISRLRFMTFFLFAFAL